MGAMRHGGVPCQTDIRFGKYPSQFSCTLNGETVSVRSRAQGGPDVMLLGPTLLGPNWELTTAQASTLVRIQRVLGGELR
jgi:hypothetical protein